MNEIHSMTMKNLLNKIESLGWKHERNSKHMIYSHPKAKKKIAIPYRHNNGLSTGVKRQILKIAQSI